MTKYTKDMLLITLMFLGIVIAAVATGGCDVPSTPTNRVVDAPQYEAEAIEIIRSTLADRLGIKLYSPTIKITWVEGDCMTGIDYLYDEPETLGTSECIEGLYTNGGWFHSDAIWVLMRDKISDSGLAHELIHRFYDEYHSSDAGDQNHSSKWWKELPIVDFHLKEKGL